VTGVATWAATQTVARPGVIELAFGEPDPALFPAAALADACRDALAGGGAEALPYGANAGPPALRRLLADRLTRLEGHATGSDETIVSGGNSLALDQLLTLFCEPGDVVLVERPTYSLALGILRDHPVTVEALPFDGKGLDVEALERRLVEARTTGARVRLLYTVPTFHNPTGVSLASARRRRLVEVAAAHGLLVVEDDVYRELWYEEPAPPSLWSLAPRGTVLRLGSLAKTVAPGLRVGWVNGAAEHVERIAGGGVHESGGCTSQFAAVVAERYLAGGSYDAHVAGLRAAYRARRDALLAALSAHLPAGCRTVAPAGGFFVWVRLPDGARASALLPAAEAAGVSYVPAARSHLDGFDGGLRLAFTLYGPDDLAAAAQRLGAALDAGLGR
jgi:DNA-binding transcriptional MocR family regulator